MKIKITLFFLFILCFLADSCKKDMKTPFSKQLVVNSPITSAEIFAWFGKFPQVTPAGILLSQAAQQTVNGQQVVRIPVATNAALYFTKENDSLKVYAYKWIYNTPYTVKYNGMIDVFNFQNQTFKRLVYTDGVITKQLTFITSGAGGGNNVHSQLQAFDIFAAFSQVWCWITGGTWYDGTSDEDGGAQGEVAMPGCNYSSSDGDGSDGGDDGTAPEFIYVDSSGDVYSSSTSGGGTTWGPPPCPPDSGNGATSVNTPHINNNITPPTAPSSPDPSGCPAAPDGSQWVAYPLQMDMDSSDGDTDADDNADGNFDNTVYPDYDQSQTWPTVSNVLLGKAYIIWFKGANCLDIAKRQIAQLGYSISNFGAPGQTIQVYTESGGANLANVKSAIGYINAQLLSGIPVIVGVDVKPGGPNPDGSTDHFIEIVGSGTDSNGNYYRFYDNSTNDSTYGTSSFNRLYYNSITGLITGNTTTLYDNATTQSNNPNLGLHPYVLTQVRKNKKP